VDSADSSLSHENDHDRNVIATAAFQCRPDEQAGDRGGVVALTERRRDLRLGHKVSKSIRTKEISVVGFQLSVDEIDRYRLGEPQATAEHAAVGMIRRQAKKAFPVPAVAARIADMSNLHLAAAERAGGESGGDSGGRADDLAEPAYGAIGLLHQGLQLRDLAGTDGSGESFQHREPGDLRRFGAAGNSAHPVGNAKEAMRKIGPAPILSPGAVQTEMRKRSGAEVQRVGITTLD
jgi:hypothetical protein